MSVYSITEARARISSLINHALAGEEVIITRYGKPVVELRPWPKAAAAPTDQVISYRRLTAHRLTPKGPTVSSV